MRAYSLDLREKIVESKKKGVPNSETTRRFGADRQRSVVTAKQLNERGTLKPSNSPSKKPKPDEKAKKLLLEDLRQRPRATHSQRAEFLMAVCGVREAKVCG